MLRLKGERDGALHDEDEARSPVLDTEETDEITSEGAFLGEDTAGSDLQEYDWRRPERGLPLRGPAIAVAAFVPTFLLVFLGVPHLVGSMAPARTPTPSVSAGPAVAPDATLAPKPLTPATPAPEAARPAPEGRASKDPLAWNPPAVENLKEEPAPPPAVQPAPALPPAPPRAAEPPATPARRAPEASRQAGAPPQRTPEPPRSPEPPRAVAEPRPAAEARPAAREPRDWTPAAAFTDRAAAGRLASSIEQQGYPVEIRQDASSSRPWVVWIGAQPSGGARRR